MTGQKYLLLHWAAHHRQLEGGALGGRGPTIGLGTEAAPADQRGHSPDQRSPPLRRDLADRTRSDRRPKTRLLPGPAIPNDWSMGHEILVAEDDRRRAE